MNFSDKLKTLRKQCNLSQEKLAEKLNVSRQAVTKWETNTGTPDIENIKSISKLFNVSLDELLSDNEFLQTKSDYLFESSTEYDLDSEKKFDIKIGSADKITLLTSSTEKLFIKLVSNNIKDLQKIFKIKIDENKNKIDIQINHAESINEAKIKDNLDILISIPQCFLNGIEIYALCKKLNIKNADLNLEFDGKVNAVDLENVKGHIELNCSNDLEVFTNGLDGQIDFNQISSSSTLHIPAKNSFCVQKKGYFNKILFSKNGALTDFTDDKNSENIIELNGTNSELVIDFI